MSGCRREVVGVEEDNIGLLETKMMKFNDKKLNLLSFGEEAEEEEKELANDTTRIKSSHDVLDDPRLLKEHVHDDEVKKIMRKQTLKTRMKLLERMVSENVGSGRSLFECLSFLDHSKKFIDI